MTILFSLRSGSFLLLVLVASASCRQGPVDQWEELFRLRHELKLQEAHLIFPTRFDGLQQAVERLERRLVDPSDLPRIQGLSRIVEVPVLKSGIELKILSALHLLEEIRRERNRLETKRLETLERVRRGLEEMGPSLQHAELQPLLAELERTLADTRSFLEPGLLREESARSARLSDQYAELRSRWIRYHGGVITVEDFQEVEERFRLKTREVRPDGYYLVIDTALNRFYLKDGEETVLEGACSTGSRRTLKSPVGKWTFETPRGEFAIRQILADPAWRMPDWAFVEEGRPVPGDEGRRWVMGALGGYALGIGGSYFIHGTEYTRLLGMNVTHGCIRLGAQDLAAVVERVSVGTPVYIF